MQPGQSLDPAGRATERVCPDDVMASRELSLDDANREGSRRQDYRLVDHAA